MEVPIQKNKKGKLVIQWQKAADNVAETVRKQKSAAQIVSRLIIQRRDSLSNDPGKKAQII